MPNNSSLIETLQQTIDHNDPTQKVIGLLAVLVDNKLNAINSNIETMKDDIGEQNKRIDQIDHAKQCPFNLVKRMEDLEKTVQPLSFVDRYPKLAVLMLIGLVTLIGLGIDNLINLL